MTHAPRPLALITGASQGIGLELARLAAADGHDLLLTARDPARLEAAAAGLRQGAAGGVRTVAADLGRPDGPATVHAALAGKRVDVLVNNAGFGAFGPFLETSIERELEMVQVNVAALLHLTKLVLPKMVAGGRGRVLNVASTAAFQPGPLMAVYYASKAFVLSFSGALANELAGSGVTVTVLCPGPTRTGFQTRAGMQRSRLFRLARVMDAATVARIGWRGMHAGRRVVVPGVQNALLVQAVRFAPRRLTAAVVRAMQAPTVQE